MSNVIEPVLNAVEVLTEAGEWLVRVTEGAHVSARSFGIESAARSYAEGQRARLNLPLHSTEHAA
jgi:hypothetical protein